MYMPYFISILAILLHLGTKISAVHTIGVQQLLPLNGFVYQVHSNTNDNELRDPLTLDIQVQFETRNSSYSMNICKHGVNKWPFSVLVPSYSEDYRDREIVLSVYSLERIRLQSRRLHVLSETDIIIGVQNIHLDLAGKLFGILDTGHIYSKWNLFSAIATVFQSPIGLQSVDSLKVPTCISSGERTTVHLTDSFRTTMQSRELQIIRPPQQWESVLTPAACTLGCACIIYLFASANCLRRHQEKNAFDFLCSNAVNFGEGYDTLVDHKISVKSNNVGSASEQEWNFSFG